MPKIKPLGDRVVIEPSKPEKQTKSGIVIPETAGDKRPVEGKITAVGPGKLNEKGERIPMSVKVGDVVLFKKYGPEEFEIDETKYLIADEDDIIAIVENH